MRPALRTAAAVLAYATGLVAAGTGAALVAALVLRYPPTYFSDMGLTMLPTVTAFVAANAQAWPMWLAGIGLLTLALAVAACLRLHAEARDRVLVLLAVLNLAVAFAAVGLFAFGYFVLPQHVHTDVFDDGDDE
jgi:hypothetical protein